MMEKLKELMKNHLFEQIYLVGLAHIEEDGIAEFIANHKLLYLEFGNQFVEIEAIEGYGRLQLTIVESFKHDNDMEDMISSRTKIGDIVFTNPMAENRVSSINFFNLAILENTLLCDVLHIQLINGQNLFIDPQFIGINIGGIEQKQFWKENFEERVLPRVGSYPTETYIKIR